MVLDVTKALELVVLDVAHEFLHVFEFEAFQIEALCLLRSILRETRNHRRGIEVAVVDGVLRGSRHSFCLIIILRVELGSVVKRLGDCLRSSVIGKGSSVIGSPTQDFLLEKTPLSVHLDIVFGELGLAEVVNDCGLFEGVFLNAFLWGKRGKNGVVEHVGIEVLSQGIKVVVELQGGLGGILFEVFAEAEMGFEVGANRVFDGIQKRLLFLKVNKEMEDGHGVLFDVNHQLFVMEVLALGEFLIGKLVGVPLEMDHIFVVFLDELLVQALQRHFSPFPFHFYLHSNRRHVNGLVLCGGLFEVEEVLAVDFHEGLNGVLVSEGTFLDFEESPLERHGGLQGNFEPKLLQLIVVKDFPVRLARIELQLFYPRRIDVQFLFVIEAL